MIHEIIYDFNGQPQPTYLFDTKEEFLNDLIRVLDPEIVCKESSEQRDVVFSLLSQELSERSYVKQVDGNALYPHVIRLFREEPHAMDSLRNTRNFLDRIHPRLRYTLS